jgi:hypothetical protein
MNDECQREPQEMVYLYVVNNSLVGLMGKFFSEGRAQRRGSRGSWAE